MKRKQNEIRLVVEVKLSKHPEFIRGAISKPKYEFSRMLFENMGSLLNSAGVRVCFKTNALNCAIRYKIDSVFVVQQIGAYLFNGLSYIVYDANKNKPFIQNGVLSRSSEEVIILKASRKADFSNFEIYFPSFNQIKEITLIMDDDAELLPADEYLHESPIIFLGGPMTLGSGATFANTMFSQIVARKLNSDFYNLALYNNNFLIVDIAQKVASFKPWLIIAEISSIKMSLVHLKSELYYYLKGILQNNKKSLLILITQPYLGSMDNDFQKKREHIQKVVGRICKEFHKQIFVLDGLTVFENIPFDHVSYSANYINDYGNMIYADKILELIYNKKRKGKQELKIFLFLRKLFSKKTNREGE